MPKDGSGSRASQPSATGAAAKPDAYAPGIARILDEPLASTWSHAPSAGPGMASGTQMQQPVAQRVCISSGCGAVCSAPLFSHSRGAWKEICRGDPSHTLWHDGTRWVIKLAGSMRTTTIAADGAPDAMPVPPLPKRRLTDAENSWKEIARAEYSNNKQVLDSLVATKAQHINLQVEHKKVVLEKAAVDAKLSKRDASQQQLLMYERTQSADLATKNKQLKSKADWASLRAEDCSRRADAGEKVQKDLQKQAAELSKAADSANRKSDEAMQAVLARNNT